MGKPRMRPRFEMKVECGVEDVMERIQARLSAGGQSIEGAFTRRHGVLMMPDTRRRFWSPQLGLSLEDVADGAWIRGRFSPHPHIWTAFMFVYGILFMFGVSGAVYAVVEFALGRSPWALLVPIGCTVLAAFVYGAAFIGQGLGAEEMYELRRFLDDCVDEAVAQEWTTPVTPRDSANL